MAEVRLYCAACAALTHHVAQGRYDHMGSLRAVDERCLRCGRTDTGHEIPQNAEVSPVELSPLEIAYCRYHSLRFDRGELTEFPWSGGVRR